MTDLRNQLNALLTIVQSKSGTTSHAKDDALLAIGDLLDYEDRVFDYFYTKMLDDEFYYSTQDLLDGLVQTSSYLETEDTTSYL